jgi:protein TonB
VCFVIEKDGSITNIELLRRIEKSLNDEAIRIIKLMPKWKPGRKNGVPVRVKYTIPIDFKL